MMRSTDEILARIAELRDSDFLGFLTQDLIVSLSFDDAQPFLKEGVDRDHWERARLVDPVAAAIGYMHFAWEKANNCRGISASRSIAHFQSWLWLAGVDGFDQIAEDEYRFYGKPVLVIIAEALGVDWRKLDDGDWRNDEGGSGLTASESEIARLVAIAQPIKDALAS